MKDTGMKRVLRFLIRLYPAWWRRRYGGELEALLEDSGSRDAWDLFRAAMEMQMKTWSFRRIVAVCGIAGVVLAGTVAFLLVPDPYQSTATIKIVPNLDAFADVTEAVFPTQVLSDIIHLHHLYADQPAADGVDRMRRSIRFIAVPPNLVQVSFAYEDPVQAQRVSQDLVGRTSRLEPMEG